MSEWRMEKMCPNCPFQDDGPGRELRKSLAPGRMDEIIDNLHSDGHFVCHKTSNTTGDGSNRLCAGALEYQEEHELSSQYVRVCERLDYARSRT